MDTAATLFSGGGGADIGLSGSGLDVKWSLEHDEEIAQVARDNGLDIHTADVTEVDPSWYERVDVLHASPPCPNFSVAKTGGEETDEDVSLAEATVRFADEIEPELFTLENVWGYRKSQSWKLIREHLQRSGYDWNAWKLNAADYGVPQTRKRMIVAARRGGPRPKKPPATHAENPSKGGLFKGNLKEWIGWYEAIDDLITDLPETELADWQKERLPDDLTESRFVSSGNTWGLDSLKGQPALTLQGAQSGYKAVLVGAGGFDGECVNREDGPSFSLTANHNQGDQLRAVLVGADTVDGGAPPRRHGRETATGIGQNGRNLRAVLVPGGNATSFVTRGDGQPSRTITERVGNRDRAVMDRRVVQMTPRALARFQSFPDWYDLPGSKSLACRIIGNAVPPLAMKKWMQHWTNHA